MIDEIREYNLKYLNQCSICCLHCISYGTGECKDSCDIINSDCENCYMKSRLRMTHRESIERDMY